MNDDNPMDEIGIQPYQPEPVKWLSEEVKEVFGCDFPNIDRFQTSQPIVGIPRETISEIIHKGNSMRLAAANFPDGEGIAQALDMSIRHLEMDVDEIIDCFVGVFISNAVSLMSTEIVEFAGRLENILGHVKPVWGVYIVDDFGPDFGQVVIVATYGQDDPSGGEVSVVGGMRYKANGHLDQCRCDGVHVEALLSGDILAAGVYSIVSRRDHQ